MPVGGCSACSTHHVQRHRLALPGDTSRSTPGFQWRRLVHDRTYPVPPTAKQHGAWSFAFSWRQQQQYDCAQWVALSREGGMGPAGSPSRGAHAVAPPPPLAHALSGAVGAVVAMALLYPLDQVRAILQVDDDLAKECSAPGGAGVLGALSRLVRRHGRAGLWRGMVPVLITMGVSNFVYFYCFTGMKAALLSRRRVLRARGVRAGGAAKPLAGGARGEGGGGLTPLESVVASTIAGVINVLATTPLWVSNLRIKAGNGVGGLFSTLGSIGRHEGLAGLWSGTAPSLVLVSNPIIQFVVYETLKQALGRRHSHRNGEARRIITQPPDPRSAAGVGSRGGAGRPSVGLRSHEAFLLGATAKTISTLVTYPLQLAQGTWQGQCNEQDDSSSPDGAGGGLRSGVAWQLLTCWSGTVDVLVSVCRRNGVGGMYQGMRAKLLHTVLTSALLFLGYERLLEVIANSMAATTEAPPPPLLPVPGSTVAAATAAGLHRSIPKPCRNAPVS